MMARPPRQPVDLAVVARDLRLRCGRIAGNLDAIAQQLDPLIADPKTTMAQTSIATILEFPTPRVRAAWVPPHASPCTVDDVEFYYLKLIQHLCNVTCRPLTLWPSDRYGPRWAGREAWVTYGDGRTREMPADAARGSTPLMTLLPRHYHARIVKHYAS